MKRAAACRLLTCGLIFAAILPLPWGSFSLASAPPAGCPHCGESAARPVSSPCCQPEVPSRCGTSGPGSTFNCNCIALNSAFVSPTPGGTPFWQVLPHIFAQVAVSSKPVIPSIFHPPEINPLPSQI